ncbi:acyl-CoA dehydrogenase [[Mycobacterium] vasticus]|uniref:Acyl-CoA dehydrogenase n=1 Tax=[Mycobacterium] vasticus TaxID=2875777 RepID=A0ABU5Z2S7_9MYCO|nr:acyl-CoA dehydrogenase [Mycolicibacter sp. MYC017]MEB3071707.1 acyl-CoA dehydrogenase [Mycolicibacter sp. MYC017]
MNFAMDDDVLTLVESIADFFERRGDASAIADASAAGAVADRERWAALCQMGLPALCLAEPDGIGAGVLEATAVAEVIGAALVPEPATGTIVLARAWGAHAPTSEFLAGLCSGSQITALRAFHDVVLSPAGDLSGAVQVPDDGVTDAVALLARDAYTAESAIVVVDRATLPAPISRTAVDPTRSAALVSVDGVEPTEVLRVSNPAADRMRREHVLLTAAELVGGMQKVLTDTIGHVKTREQFGRPIGSFQAIKHKLADMYAATEQARAAVQFAALDCATNTDAGSTSVAAVARWVPRSAIDLFEEAVHLYGAMGYSWEVPVHLHLRRALSIRALINAGSIVSHRRSAAIPEAV